MRNTQIVITHLGKGFDFNLGLSQSGPFYAFAVVDSTSRSGVRERKKDGQRGSRSSRK